ncbi:MAG: LysR family transcriptional regulator [Sphingomonadales bacterium]|nr:LysR family transcriptional regulator [Sphingomonadales bacterium]
MTPGNLPGSFDFRALQVFVVTAEQGSMTAAAKVLGLTQSGVSQIIASLEESVGRQLFDRSIRPILLTKVGQVLMRQSQKILSDLNSAYVEAAESEGNELSSLTIAMPESLANVLGPRLIQRKPEIAKFWHISNGLLPEQRAKFNTHAADLMITEESNTSDMLDVDRFNLFSEPYVLIFPKDFQLTPELGPHLSASPFIRFSLRSSMGRQTEAQLNRLQLKFPSQIEFDSVVGHATAISFGLGWGITTPLCLFQVSDILDKVAVYPIARGKFGRRMTLLARQHALGSAPRIVTEECRDILSQDVFPALLGRMPWLEDSLRVGED